MINTSEKKRRTSFLSSISINYTTKEKMFFKRNALKNQMPYQPKKSDSSEWSPKCQHIKNHQQYINPAATPVHTNTSSALQQLH